MSEDQEEVDSHDPKSQTPLTPAAMILGRHPDQNRPVTAGCESQLVRKAVVKLPHDSAGRSLILQALQVAHPQRLSATHGLTISAGSPSGDE